MSSAADRTKAPGEGRSHEGANTIAKETDRDEQALVLREEGRSFASIARELGLNGIRDANSAFNRALRLRPASQQESLRSREMTRLDALGERVRQRDDLSEAEVASRIRGLDRLREMLLST